MSIVDPDEAQYRRAATVMPGGVNSSTRLNESLGRPFYVARAAGSRVWDLAGREFVDMSCAHGAALLGHAAPAVDEALRHASELGYANSFETPFHEELAARFCDLIPCAERVRFCSSGSEATLHMLRVCRAFTGRRRIIRFEGHFHGYHELIYIGGHPPPEALSGNRLSAYVESPGIPGEMADLIISVPFNDRDAVADVVNRHGDDVAAIVLEPVNYNCGCIKPDPGYLEFLREMATAHGIILFFDEVQSAFKRSAGGAQEDYGVTPDVATVGKSLGGGLPLSAFCGRADIMDLYKPVGPVQHSGTFNAHLVPVLCGLAFLKELSDPGFYRHLQRLEDRLHTGIDRIISDHDLNVIVPQHGARFNVVLGRRTPPRRYEDTFCHDPEVLLRVFRACWERGVYFHPYGGTPCHHGYSSAHTEGDVDLVLNVLEDVLPAETGVSATRPKAD